MILVLAIVSGLVPGRSGAQAPFNPAFLAGTSNPYHDQYSSLAFDISQNQNYSQIASYQIDVPDGWHIAMNSVDYSSKTRCTDITPANAAASAEQIGYVILTLINDDTGGPAKYQGGLWYLQFDNVTQTATFCGLVRAGGSSIPAANREIMFEVRLRAAPDGILTMTWAFTASTGAAAGSRSIADNDYFASKHTSVLYTRIELNTLTAANYHTDVGGNKSAVRFVWNPSTNGSYPFNALFVPCETSGKCVPAPSGIRRTSIIKITDYPQGFHPGSTFTAPALWSVWRGGVPIPIKWRPPARTSAADVVRGYAVTVSADYVPDSQKSMYFLAGQGACASAIECSTTLSLPYYSDVGVLVPQDNTYSMTLVTIYADGHRSDGRCDDGTVSGAEPPCPNDTVPAWTAAGIARTQFLYRERAWPLGFREIKNAGDSDFGAWQIFILMADLEGHSFEFITWKPLDRTYGGGGLSVNGRNATGGVIEFHQTVGPQHWYLDAYMTTSSASGLWALTSSTNDIQDMYRFNMSKV